MNGAGRVLALDPGDRAVGVAVTDAARLVLTPLPPVVRTDGGLALGAFRRLFEEWKPAVVVVGAALREDGTLGETGRRHRAFAGKLAKHFPALPFVPCDERYSTRTAREQAPDAVKGDHAANLDSLAAVEILKTWLADQETKAARARLAAGP